MPTDGARRWLAIVTAGVVLSLPLLIYGPLPNAHDAAQHLAWYREFSAQFWAGDHYPRWISGLNAGLGSPIFFVYGPLPFFIPTLLQPILGKVMAFNAAAALSLVLSGCFAYLWLRCVARPSAAMIGAVAYIAMPYHLWADLYVRFALPECWAFAWMPLILFFALRVAEGRRFSIPALALSYALLIATHLFTTVIFTPVLIAYTILLTRHNGGRVARGVSAGLALGVGLSAIYTLPALEHEKFISSRRLTQEAYYRYSNNFLVTDRSLVKRDPNAPFSWMVTWLAIAVAPVALAGYWLTRRATLLWIVIAALSLFMMTSLSRPVWVLIPMLQNLQFPWRFHILLSLAAVPIIAVAAASLHRPWGVRHYVAGILALLFMLSCVAAAVHPWLLYRKQVMSPEYQADLAIDADYLRRVWAVWTEPGMLTSAALGAVAARTPQAGVASGSAGVTVLRWRPRDLAFQVDSPNGATVRVKQFYYPRWQARVVGEGSAIPIVPSVPEGLIQLSMPAGVHNVEVRLPRGTAEIAGGWISALSCAGFILLLFRPPAKLSGLNN